MKNFAKDNLTLGIIGAGVMGRGIAQIAAISGVQVIIFDIEQSACKSAVDFIERMLDRAVEKGKLTKNEAELSKENISTIDDINKLSSCDVIVEAIIEKLDIKQSLFRDLEAIVSPDCIITTNTSSLSVTSIAAGCNNSERVAGLHFFNPVPLMKLVEVIRGLRTNNEVIKKLCELSERFGHNPVVVSDSPGFLVNHIGRGLVTEGLRIIYENVTDPQTVDSVIRDCMDFRMGPFELMDLTGLDVTFPATEQIYQQYFHEPRLRPTPFQQRRFSAGLYGRKVGEGFYLYKNNEKVTSDEPPSTISEGKLSFWVTSNCEPELRKIIIDLLNEVDCLIDTADKPGADSIAIVLPLGWDVSTASHMEELNAVQTIGIDSLLNLNKRIVLMTNPTTTSKVIDETRAIFLKTGRSVSVIKDSAGFISQRMIATIVNIACELAQQGIAKPQDIDKGAKLGLGYPEGPLEMGNEIGAGKILTILENIFACYGDMRYRPSPWLKRRAKLNLSLLHTD